MTIYLDPKLVPPQLRVGYTGQKFAAIVCTEMTVPVTAGLWNESSRDTYKIVRLEDGAALKTGEDHLAPWSEERKEHKVKLDQRFAVVRHTISRGVDMGLTFYIHPGAAAPMLPKAVTLTETERAVLNIIGGIKSAYRASEAAYKGISPADYDAAKVTLTAQGLLNKAGAITIAGRNAR